MKTETKENKSMVAQLREIRDKMSLEIQDMNAEDMLAYYRSKKSLFPSEVLQQNSSSLDNTKANAAPEKA